MNALTGLLPTSATMMQTPSIGEIASGGFGLPSRSAPIADGQFHAMLENAIGKVDGLQQGADLALEGLASGKNVDLHGTMIALEQADIALRAATTVRDKFISAYEAVMNMAV